MKTNAELFASTEVALAHWVDGVLPVPIDHEGPAYWDEFFGPTALHEWRREPVAARDASGEPRRYSTVRLKRGTGPYRSWEDFMARTSEADRMAWCAMKAKKANGPRLMSGRPNRMTTKEEVWAVLERARGRCCHCGSLAVERRPSKPTNGAPVAWGHVGRRIGSLEHLVPRCGSRWDGFDGSNGESNFGWACLWCNDWPSERIWGALDHGGYYPVERNESRVNRPARERANLKTRVATIPRRSAPSRTAPSKIQRSVHKRSR